MTTVLIQAVYWTPLGAVLQGKRKVQLIAVPRRYTLECEQIDPARVDIGLSWNDALGGFRPYPNGQWATVDGGGSFCTIDLPDGETRPLPRAFRRHIPGSYDAMALHAQLPAVREIVTDYGPQVEATLAAWSHSCFVYEGKLLVQQHQPFFVVQQSWGGANQHWVSGVDLVHDYSFQPHAKATAFRLDEAYELTDLIRTTFAPPDIDVFLRAVDGLQIDVRRPECISLDRTRFRAVHVANEIVGRAGHKLLRFSTPQLLAYGQLRDGLQEWGTTDSQVPIETIQATLHAAWEDLVSADLEAPDRDLVSLHDEVAEALRGFEIPDFSTLNTMRG